MIRRFIMQREAAALQGFRMRGESISRLEAFSDAVFGFAITLLVVSLEVPHTFDQLLITMRGFFGFALTFFCLLALWYRHYQFFRRYGLNDLYTIVLNGILLFVILFYIYPLKFITDLMITLMMTGSIKIQLASGSVVSMLRLSQFSLINILLGTGAGAVFGVFALLYHHAYCNRKILQLNELETLDTRITMGYMAIVSISLWMMAGVGIIVGPKRPVVPGAIMYGMVFVIFFYRKRMRRRRAEIVAMQSRQMSS